MNTYHTRLLKKAPIHNLDERRRHHHAEVRGFLWLRHDRTEVCQLDGKIAGFDPAIYLSLLDRALRQLLAILEDRNGSCKSHSTDRLPLIKSASH